jgi:predicted aspartyl protease
VNKKRIPQGYCFTTSCRGISRALFNDVELESAINPAGRKKLRALWDTGATTSLIRPEIAAELQLHSLGKIFISTPSEKDIPSNVYSVNLYLPNRTVVNQIRVSEGVPSNCDMLIGMDVINLGDFAVTNYNGRTVFSFRMPSMDTIDFVKNSHIPPIINDQKTGRNDPCPCGSGRKYKHCHGR